MRYVSIDILRTFAIVLMVFVHFLENLGGAVWTPAGFGAPIFTFLVGVSYRLWAVSQEAKNKTDEEITAISLRRAGFLFLLGFIFNATVWLPGDLFNWDVLTLIGTGLFILTFIRNLPLSVPVFMAGVAALMGPALRELTDYQDHWIDGYFDHDWSFGDILMGYLSTGYFPIFPWLTYPLVGYVVGSLMFPTDPEATPPIRGCALIGLGLMTLSCTALLLRVYAPESMPFPTRKVWTMFPASPEFVAGTLGMAMFWLPLLHRIVDQNPNLARYKTGPMIVRTFSQHSLTMYLFHHVVHLMPLWIYGAASGAELTTYYWRQALPIWSTIPLAILCLLVAFVLFRWMDSTGRHGIEGWMRRLCG